MPRDNKAAAAGLRAGVCKLTRTSGKFVKSHLIPLALTRLSRSGEKHIETGIGHASKKRSNSWYDGALVTREGEDVLSEIDSRGISVLRKYKLVWSGWSPGEDLASNFESLGSAEHGVRHLDIEDAEGLQLFFLSLVWRAAASERPEFSDVRLGHEVLEDIRLRVVQQASGPFGDYPVQLFQLSTRGFEHNRTPLLERKRIPLCSADGWGPEVSYVRFYFDGLVAHVHVSGGGQLVPEYLRSCLGLGVQGGTIVFGHRFDNSRAWDNIKEMVRTVHYQGRTPPSEFTAIASAVRAVADTESAPRPASRLDWLRY